MKKYGTVIILLLIFTNITIPVWLVFGRLNMSGGGAYKWLNPQLKFLEAPVLSKAAYEVFRSKLMSGIDEEIAVGRAENIAVFFRDLASGPTFSINPNKKFTPASLLKIPLAMTYFRMADEGQIYLAQKLVPYNFTLALKQKFSPVETIKPGELYEIQDLLRRMLAFSDNGAWEVLYDNLRQITSSDELLLETFKDVGIIDAATSNIDNETLSVKSYASLFRLLYNASYLSKESSDKLLQYLSESTFNDGLRRGVPDNIQIAHKLGERYAESNYYLHDCGIVYYPKNPYLLCVMTHGENIDDLAGIIGQISKDVYEEVDSRRL